MNSLPAFKDRRMRWTSILGFSFFKKKNGTAHSFQQIVIEHLLGARPSSVLGSWDKAVTTQCREGPCDHDAFVLSGGREPVYCGWQRCCKTVKQSDVRGNDRRARVFGEVTFELRSSTRSPT